MTRLPDESISFQNTTGDSGVENLYVYGKLTYDFKDDDLNVKSLTVSGISSFTNDVSFAGDITLDEIAEITPFEYLMQHEIKRKQIFEEEVVFDKLLMDEIYERPPTAEREEEDDGDEEGRRKKGAGQGVNLATPLQLVGKN